MRGPFLPLLFFLALFLKPTSPSSHSTSSGSSLIICGVDGSVYTLSAWDGSLMGKFMSGSAVVSSSTMSERLREQQEANGDVNSGKDGGANVGTRSQSRSGSKSLQSHQPTIVPGLDGLIYTLSASGSLDLLSVSAMDIVDTPLATCTPSPSVDPITGEVTDGNTEECGMLMGEKRSRVFALDVAKGTVRWVQYVGERDKGFTTTESKVYAESQGEGDGGDLFQSDEAKNTRNPVLLQRDDYIIRQVSIHSGDEAWNLTVSHFSALDFDFDSGASDVMGGGQEGESEQGRSMAIAGGLGWEGGQRVFPRMSGRREDDDTLALFPKIVWGSSGSSLSAYDPVTMDLLWSKEIESTVTTMYGVDDNNHWVPLTFLTEEDVNKGGGRGSGEDNNGDINNEKNDSNDDNNYGHPSTIVPFDNAHNSVIQYQRQGLQSLLGASRLGRVLTEGGSTLFITPVRDTAIVPHALGNRDGGVVIVDVDDDMIGLNDLVCTSENESDDSCPSGGTGADHFPTTSPITQQPTHHHSHSSQEGLFLTWQFLLLSLVFILFVAVFLGRMAYTELKQRWLKKLINTPKLLKEITADEKQTSKHDHNPPEMRLGTPDLRSRNGSAQDKTLHSRSASMPALSLDKSTGSGEDDETIGSRSLNGAGINGEKPSSTLTSTSASTILKEVQNVNLELRGDRNRNPSASASPSPPPPPQPAAETIQTPTARELPSEIDGIPLVLYPRYSREFTEKSALGRGGFGAVYRCSNIVDGREYAIKKIRIDTSVLIGDDDSLITTNNKSLSTKLKKVLREVKILALLDHPNIVRYYTAWLERDEEATTPVGGSDKHYDGSRKAQFDSTLDPMMEEITTDASLNNSFSLPTAHKNGGNNVTFTDGTDCGEKSDLGFNWEPNTNSINPNDISTWSENSSNEEGAYVDMSSGGNKKGSIIDGESQRTMRVANNKDTTDDSGDEGERPRTPRLLQRHILYIQMRYCSQKTLRDFLSSPDQRKYRRQASSGNSTGADKRKNSNNSIDLPHALELFGQVAKGVKHVHGQGLIHRDLKPSNCFVDENGIVKIGDFGLSRESSGSSAGGGGGGGGGPDVSGVDISSIDESFDRELGGMRNTAGVGTYMYASPEQISGGGEYDASTDVYSLGVMLFEMCYPMYTSMERSVVLTNVHKRIFPAAWTNTVAKENPDLQQLLEGMLSRVPTERPTSEDVCAAVEGFLGKLTVLSLDRSKSRGDGSVLLRVEADERDDVMSCTVGVIKTAWEGCNILQYGLRGDGGVAVMEFALERGSLVDGGLDAIISALKNGQGVRGVSEVSDG